jgi:hypothetical protein
MEDQVWYVDTESGKLVSAYKKHAGSQRVEAANPISVTLENVVVAEDFDGLFRGDNDLLILSRSACGKKHPKVQRIHEYQEGVPAKKPIKNIFSNTMFLTDDYNGNDKLWLELSVVEVDKDLGDRKAAVKAFSKLASMAGAVFPAVLPYAFGASAVVSLANQLVSALEENEDVLIVPLNLYPGKKMRGRVCLQTGTYVVFRIPLDATNFSLLDNGILDAGDELKKITYAVFNIDTDKLVDHRFVINQKVATLLTQMQQDEESPSAKVEAINFLTNTLTQYDNYNKLDRYLGLKGKSKAKLTDAEKKLMEDIKKINALEPFLP